MTPAVPPTVNLDTCASEPIHIPGRIQSFGALVALNSDWLIAHVSDNCATFLGWDKQPRPGDALTDYVSPDAIAVMRRKLEMMVTPGSVERVFGMTVADHGPRFDLALHVSGRTVVCEFEHHEAGDYEHHVALLRPMMARLEQLRDPGALCDAAARQVKALLGFDRVMVYRFEPDDSGEVFAEAREPELEGFFGLHYPASDIPPQARALYLRNILRLIADVDDPTVVIQPTLSPAGVPLDLSLSTLRSVSPIHIEYLRNMGVTASLSISIIVRGKLWGLFACHHYSGPHVLPYSLRSAAELFAQLFALQLDQVLSDEVRLQVQRGQALHDRLMVQLAESASLIEHFDTMIALVGDVIAHDGASAFIDGQYIARGSAPDFLQFKDVLPLFNSGATSSVVSSSALGEAVPGASRFGRIAAGALAIPVSRRPRDYIVFWRRERKQTVTWAGKPHKHAEVGPNGIRLTPRKSFEAWQEVVDGKSLPWSEDELRAAESLRITLLEVILRITDAAMAERARAQEQQELLIAELNHRVRNILNLIRGLISQSRHESTDIATFTDTIGGRIGALALAHDSITRENWAPSSIAELIAIEAKAYLNDKAGRIQVNGDDALVAPEAFSVLALVLHELMTNSVKYGAMCDHHGRVEIDLARNALGDLTIAWRENGGPPVKAPKRRGFGSLIVERSIPHELQGKADVRYQLAGLEADFTLPARHIRDCTAASRTAPVIPAPPSSGADPPRRVLLVEDNMIIALDTEENLIALGVEEVLMAGSNDAALAIIENGVPEFALLDFNLGGETSEPTARALDQRGVPFAFATGYGEVESMIGKYAHNPAVLQKPYSKDDLARVVRAPEIA